MWRMELSVVWMVATGKLQYPLQKPVSSLSQTVIGCRKRFRLCFGFQFWSFLFYKSICRSGIQQQYRLNWSELGSEKITGMTKLQMWYPLLKKNRKKPSCIDYEYKLHLMFVYWIISSLGVMVQGMCTRSAKQNISAIK